MQYIKIILCTILLSSLIGCVTNQSRNTRIDNVPMYGQPEIVRPDILKKADKDFIDNVVSEYGDRKKASTLWWQQGDKFANEGNLDYAMRRYNQSWLLDPNNYQPYWGFARVSLQQRKIDTAIEYLEKSSQLINDPYQEVALLTDMASAYTQKAKHEKSLVSKDKYFDLANKNFKKSIKLDPNYPNSWRSWAYSLFYQKKYKESNEKVEKAKELKARPFPKSFLTKLAEKLK